MVLGVGKMIPYLISHSPGDLYNADEEPFKSLEDVELPELNNQAQWVRFTII